MEDIDKKIENLQKLILEYIVANNLSFEILRDATRNFPEYILKQYSINGEDHQCHSQ